MAASRLRRIHVLWANRVITTGARTALAVRGIHLRGRIEREPARGDGVKDELALLWG